MGSSDILRKAEFLSLVPAGGMGTRLGALTKDRAKPALAIGFDKAGNIRRMIDIPLDAIHGAGGAALVTTFFAAETLDFVNQYPYAQTRREFEAGSPIDSLIAELAFLEASSASIIGIIPGDAYINAVMLETMRNVLEHSYANAAILATRHLGHHNVRPIGQNSMMTTEEHQIGVLADLGVHLIKKEWLLARLRQYQSLSGAVSIDIWADIYSVHDPATGILLHVPEDDPIAIDMGTGPAFHRYVSRLNVQHSDKSSNIVFPEARIGNWSTETIALPRSSADFPLARVTIPEGRNVTNVAQTLRG